MQFTISPWPLGSSLALLLSIGNYDVVTSLTHDLNCITNMFAFVRANWYLLLGSLANGPKQAPLLPPIELLGLYLNERSFEAMLRTAEK